MNPVIETLLDIAKYSIPAIVVLIATYSIVKKFLVNEIERKRLAIFEEGQGKTMMLRLQAYERLSIFVERIHPRSLMSRVYNKDLTNSELQYLLVQNIQQEYEHNLSQQIYVSNEVWRTVTSVKEQELAMINSISSQLDPQSAGRDLYQKIIDYVRNSEQETPVEIALEVINREAKTLLLQNR